MQKRQTRLLYELLSQPTAPFREQQVMALAERQLTAAGVPYFYDPAGNLVVGVDTVRAYRALLARADREPVRLFIAHMDHPGCHGRRWESPRLLEVKWHGGSPVKHLRGAWLWLSSGDGVAARGRIVSAEIADHGRAMATARIRLPDEALFHAQRRAKEIYGGFDFRAPVWQRGGRIYTRAADDLGGVFCILETARSLFRGRRRDAHPPFIGLLSRAEEVGFVGTIAHLELGWWRTRKRPLVCVSLEASHHRAGAAIGKGPVVRLGDRRTVFDAHGLKVLDDLAGKLLPGACQRRIMDGGACEGTAATAYGIPTIALSIPLGNYHNEGYDGGMDCPKPRGPAPEFVHVDDLAGELRLCHGLMKPGLPWGDPWQDVRTRLTKNHARYARLLKTWGTT